MMVGGDVTGHTARARMMLELLMIPDPPPPAPFVAAAVAVNTLGFVLPPEASPSALPPMMPLMPMPPAGSSR